MKHANQSPSSKRGSGSSTTSSRRSSSLNKDNMNDNMGRGYNRNDDDRYGVNSARMSSRQDSRDYRLDDMEFRQPERQDYGQNYRSEGMSYNSGRNFDSQNYGESSREEQYRDDREREFSRGRSGEYYSVNDQGSSERNLGRSPWRDTYDNEKENSSRGSSLSSQHGSSRGYNEDVDHLREARYGAYRDRNERVMNNYDNQDENPANERSFRGYR